MSTASNAHQPLSAAELADAKSKVVQLYKAGQIRQAFDIASQTADRAPQDLDINTLAGALGVETGEASTATRYLLRATSIQPHHPQALFLLGNALGQQDMHEQAIDAYQKSLEFDANNADAALNLGLALRKRQDNTEAEKWFNRALEINPDHAEAHNAIANFMLAREWPDKAEFFARKAHRLAPNTVQYVVTLAQALQAQRRYVDSENLFKKTLEQHPHDTVLLCEYGNALREQNQFDEAEEQFRRALELAPKSSKILQATAGFFSSIKKYKDAADVYERLISVSPEDASAYNNLAIVYRDLNRFDDAKRSYEKCIELMPGKPFGFNNLAILNMEMGMPEESIRNYKKALEINPNYFSARSNMVFNMNYLSDMSREELFGEHVAWATNHTEPMLEGNPVHGNTIDPERRLRIGYISPDLCGHAVSYYIEAALKNHDTEKFDIYCYAAVPAPDNITERLQSYGAKWRFIQHLKDGEIVQQIRDDEIDILVDLAGHTAGTKLTVMALKPAPVQVTWIGYPNTTGLSTIDYRFVDEVTDPTGEADAFHTEKLWRLPRTFSCYYPTAHQDVPEHTLFNETGQVNFGSFNNSSKLSPATIKLWSRILNKVPNANLLLKSASFVDEATCERLKKAFAAEGIAQERIELYGRMPSHEHLAFYGRVDIALDSIPYNGTTTSCEAMWMGSPVITMLGDRHAARVTGSMLINMGLSELVGDSEDDYVDIAANLANDPDRLKDLHATMRDRMKNSALCDEVGHTREVEDAYREMWRIWCAEEPARREERRALGRPETEPYMPPARLVQSLPSDDTNRLFQCLACIDDVALLSDAHPLGMMMFPPVEQARDWYGLFSKEETADIRRRDLQYEKEIVRIHLKAREAGKNLVLRDWTHMDYIALPFMATPSFHQGSLERLDPLFDVANLFIVQHPLRQWNDYKKLVRLHDVISVDMFCRGFRKFAENAVTTKFLRLEDFCENPAEVLQDICAYLNIDYDDNWQDNWAFYTNITGIPPNRPLYERVSEEIKPLNAPEASPEDATLFEENDDYKEALRLLGYA